MQINICVCYTATILCLLFRLQNVVIKHNVESQKSEGFTRYDVDQSDKFHLDDELRLGHIEV